MSILFKIILANIIVSLGSLIGAIPLFFHARKLNNFLIFFVSLSAGTLMGGAFIHLLPEAINEIAPDLALNLTLISFLAFFLLEKLLHWHHCHNPSCTQHATKTVGYMNLFGDLIHNFLDGLVIAATFLTSPELGIITTFAIALHEIPQEIGDIGVLLHPGFKKQKAIFFNFLIALSAVFGGIVGYFFSGFSENTIPYLLSIAAGGFLYISASDLLPEIKEESHIKKSFISIFIFFLGILIMLLLKD